MSGTRAEIPLVRPEPTQKTEGPKVDVEQLLNFSCDIGHELMQNGAEIYRVEESIKRLIEAYGYETSEELAIPSAIVLNIQVDGINHCKMVRNRSASNNLRRLYLLNSLCRTLCREKPSLDEARRRFDEIMAEKPYSDEVSYLGYGLAAFFFTLFWGGCFEEAVVAFPCGLLARFVISFMEKVQANTFFVNLVTAALIAVPPVLLTHMGLMSRPDTTIIGSIMLLVPGMAITNVMRDVLAGDFLTALTRLAEVLIVAMGISAGVATTITLFRMFWV